MRLTDQQQIVVNHNHGPALVFAVAGAGKTTAMVHRIERLVREKVFAPEQILATSFGRANVTDLKRELRRWHYCADVDGRTLHSLGRDIILYAQKHGYLRDLKVNGERGESVEQTLLNFTLAEAYRRNVPYKKELDTLDRQDFLSYVGYCKGNLYYADLRRAKLPDAAMKLAKKAQPPPGELGWYLDLYQLMEQVRLKSGFVTFDDMLLTGWECLVRYPELQTAVKKRYACIIVDEYQDINLVQSAILDILSETHRNLMAIGDDDQTIYEWRGADPRFILDFGKQYGVEPYLITDNFRCPAAPLALANAVIAHNKRRSAKRLQLTKGFGGKTAVYADKTIPSMSKHIIKNILELKQTGTPLHDIAVLVRLNAQTPHIEQELITHKIPYRVSKPFYERWEIQTLIHYGRVAWLNNAIADGKRPLTNTATRRKFEESWRGIVNRPKRYISRDMREKIYKLLIRQPLTISDAITQTALGLAEWQAEPLDFLAEDIEWLAERLDEPASKTLDALDRRLGYREFLRESSGFPQTGEGRAASVTAFIQYARDKGTVLEFMQHIQQLATQKAGRAMAADTVTLSTIHQSKGLEWPVVIIPQCNQDILPFQVSRAGDVEEERRLFYVALTRTKRDLHLHYVKNEPPSPFLAEAAWKRTLPALEKLRELLEKSPEGWTDDEVQFLVGKTAVLHLQRYFTTWHQSDREAIGRRVVAWLEENGGKTAVDAAWWREMGIK